MAISSWWKSLSKDAKAQYIKDHPNSKYAKGSEAHRKERNKGIAKVFSRHKPGSLHAYLGVEKGKKIPITKLRKLANSNHELASRARLVLTLQGHKLKRPAKRKTRTKRA